MLALSSLCQSVGLGSHLSFIRRGIVGVVRTISDGERKEVDERLVRVIQDVVVERLGTLSVSQTLKEHIHIP